MGPTSVSRLHRNINVAAVIVPFLAFLMAVPLLWNDLIGWTDLAILLALYLLSGFGITVGFHRLLTHRAFETYRPVKYLFAVLGTFKVL
jgi:stearoyl-CoA desaturase (Delta-9 desaturase)